MIIKKLNLHAFGPFTDRILDFSHNKYGLHIVCGANEAGKSTILRAFIGLLYGFGHIVKDSWRHENKKLAVGGEFFLPDNTLIKLTRYKRRKNDLIDENTGHPFNQTELDKYLGRMGKEAFQHTFGISHDSLRMGVESVLAAGGDLGQALFAATSGLNTLKLLMTDLNEKQNQMFAPRAAKPKINAGIAEIKSLRKQQREASASHHHWKKLKKKTEELCQLENEAENNLKTLSKQISRLSRHMDALKHVSAQELLKKELHALAEVPDLHQDFSHERVATQVSIKQAEKLMENIVKDIHTIDMNLNDLVYDEKIIANKILIENFMGEVKVHIKARTDSQSVRARMYQHRNSAEKTLAQLRPGLCIQTIESLRLSRLESSRIYRLGARGIKLKESAKTTEQMLKKSQTVLANLQQQIRNTKKTLNTETLETALSLARKHGKLEDRLEASIVEVELLKKNISMELSALGLWKGSMDALERLPIPLDETIRNIETVMTELDKKYDKIKTNQKIALKKLESKKNTLSEMTPFGRLPSMEDLRISREIRDIGWKSVRSVWLNKGVVDKKFMNRFPECSELADAYEKSVVKADNISDVLRENAEAVAQTEALKKDIKEFQSEINNEGVRLDKVAQKQNKIWRDWVRLWKPCNVTPLSPREMLSWSTGVKTLKQKAEGLRKQEAEVLRLKKNMDRACIDISSALEGIHIQIPEKANYGNLTELAEKTLISMKKSNEKRKDIQARISALTEEVNDHKERQQEIKHEIDTWTGEWMGAIGKLGFDSDADSEEVQEFLQTLEDIFTQLDKAKEFEVRNTKINEDYLNYSERLANISKQLAPDIDIKNTPPEDVAIELNARLTTNMENRKESLKLNAEKQKKLQEKAGATEKLTALNEKMRLLCMEAGAQTPEELPEIEKRSRAKTVLLNDLDKVNERLSELAMGQAPELFIKEVKNHDPDELRALLEKYDSDKKKLQETHKELVAEHALAKKELESISGESQALKLAEKAEGLIAKTQNDVAHYVKLRLSSAILTKAIERYRQTNQSPVLKSAGQYFKTITQNAFSGLRADYNDQGEPVLKAIRPDSSLLTVNELSDGSRDQLFLSLRMGGLSRYVQNNGPIPFIIDDVLVHFDDNRSAAALKAITTLSERTQIIFFTHHYHLTDLAEKTLTDDVLRVHYL